MRDGGGGGRGGRGGGRGAGLTPRRLARRGKPGQATSRFFRVMNFELYANSAGPNRWIGVLGSGAFLGCMLYLASIKPAAPPERVERDLSSAE